VMFRVLVCEWQTDCRLFAAKRTDAVLLENSVSDVHLICKNPCRLILYRSTLARENDVAKSRMEHHEPVSRAPSI
ncbi:MAG: hypothetical protein Q7T55_10330, partial [Solirubrobacteraceae bacterium]|nr:hypothetical protein [Solirubrobacteraceae bacterium]